MSIFQRFSVNPRLAILTAIAGLACAPALAEAAPAWWNYERAATHDAVQSHVYVPVRDATLIGCDLYQPAQGLLVAPGRFPGIVAEFTPYFVPRATVAAEAKYFATRGYNVIVCNVRGTGDSGGTWSGVASAIEMRDGYDLVEWLAAQPWSNGRIGQQGFSYGGFTTYRAAAAQPPHLIAIAPFAAQSNLYLNNPYPGGIPATPGGTINNWPAIGSALSGGRINPAAEWATWASHPNYDDFWKQIAIATKYEQIRVPILGTGGWDDNFFRKSMVDNHQALRSRSWTIYGPWTHANPFAWPDGSGAPADAPLPPGALLAWWDHWLKQIPGAPLPSARFTSYEGPVGVGAGWQELNEWPPRDVRPVTLALTSYGALDRRAASDDVSFQEPALTSLALIGGGSLAFTSGQLSNDTVLAGSVRLHLRAVLSAPDANFYVQLLDVAPDGSTTLVNDGFLRASHRLSHETPTPIEPNQPTEFDIEIWPDHWRFAANHYLRITVSGGDPTALQPPPEPVGVTLIAGKRASYAVFPLRANGGDNLP